MTGAFLVDGQPVGRLPDAITSSSEYGRTFGGRIFEVQPGEVTGTYITSRHINGSLFTFSTVNSRVVICEHRADGRKLTLIPHTHFQGDMPQLLVDDYSHWLEQHSFVDRCVTRVYWSVHMRPTRADSTQFSDWSVTTVPYKLVYHKDSDSIHLVDIATGQLLVDVRSTSFEHLYSNMMCRLETASYTHVLVDRVVQGVNSDDNADIASKTMTATIGGSDAVTIKLPRMRLAFDINTTTGAVTTR
jgi:hypothetical protein